MKTLLVILLSFAFSFPALGEEEDEADAPFLILNRSSSEFHLHSLTQEGYLPFSFESPSPQESTYRLKILLDEADDSLKELTVEIGGKTNSFDPSKLLFNQDFDLNSLKIIPILGVYEEGEWNWSITIELSSNPPLEDCREGESLVPSHFEHRYQTNFYLKTKEGFTFSFYDFSDSCHQK